MSVILILPKRFIFITPQPPFAGLCRYHYRVLSGMVVFGGVFVGRAVAAKCGAGLAGTQVYPVIAGFNAFIAYIFSGLYRFGNLGKVLANRFAHSL
jgi:hypothetical protein